MDIMREESGNEPVAAFSMSHPAVPALYTVLTLGLTMFSMQPVLIALSLAGGLAYGLATRGAARTLGALRWQLPVILIIAVLNPLFSASGSTELFHIGMRAVYLESMVYGLCMGGLFVASVLMGWGMEDSLERADAMRSRGWGAATRRTTYARYRLGRGDVAALAGLALFGVATAAVAWAATTQYSFYPQLSVPAPWPGYVVYAAWMALPCVLRAIDEKRFG